jgi:hypothetical protein
MTCNSLWRHQSPHQNSGFRYVAQESAEKRAALQLRFFCSESGKFAAALSLFPSSRKKKLLRVAKAQRLSAALLLFGLRT